MTKYIAKFYGRKKGAIGICFRCEQAIIANSKDLALLKLYDTHEHISDCVFVEVPL